jgi:hypothetical protein
MKYTGIKENKPEYYRAWFKYFAELNKEMQKRADNNVATEASMLWSDILDCVERWKIGSLEHVTLALYTMIPPRRQFDYWKIWIKTKTDSFDNKPNSTGMIDIKNKLLTVTEYKTKDTYDVFTKELPPILINTISKYRPNGGWLFTKTNGEIYKNVSTFADANNNVIKRALGNPNASVNTLRHAAASFVSTNPSMLRGDKKQFAKDMGHSLAMQGVYVQVHNKNS